MFKNVASQKITFFAFIPSTGLPKTGDAANITAYVAKDDGSVTVLGDTSATERDATNAKGNYSFDLTQAETNADKLEFSAKSSTSDVSLIPITLFTRPANAGLLSIDSNGRVDAIKVAGTTQTARDLGASVLLSPGTGTGQVNLTSGAVPVVGDLTATMKTSVTTAASAATPILATDGIPAAALSTAAVDKIVDAMVLEIFDADDLAAEFLATGSLSAFAAGTVGKILSEIHLRVSQLSTKTGAVVADGGNSSTVFVTDLTEASNDYWKDSYMRITSGVLINQVKKVSGYNGTTKAITVTGGFTATPAAAVTFEIINK
jgi:hypothetical protein